MGKNTHNLDHDIRNPLLGIVLEQNRMRRSMASIERFLKRMDNATKKQIQQWVKEYSNSVNDQDSG